MSERNGKIAVAASLAWIAVAVALILGTHEVNVASADALEVESPSSEWMVMPASHLDIHAAFEAQIQC